MIPDTFLFVFGVDETKSEMQQEQILKLLKAKEQTRFMLTCKSSFYYIPRLKGVFFVYTCNLQFVNVDK